MSADPLAFDPKNILKKILFEVKNIPATKEISAVTIALPVPGSKYGYAGVQVKTRRNKPTEKSNFRTKRCLIFMKY